MKLYGRDLIFLGCITVTGLSFAGSAFAAPARQANKGPTGPLAQYVSEGNRLLTLHQFQPSIVQYEKALELDPKNPVVKENLALAHNNWGIFLFNNQKKIQEAYSQFQEALEIFPSLAIAKSNMTKLEAVAQRMGMQLGKQDKAPEQEGAPEEGDKQEAAGGKANPNAGQSGDSQVPGYEKSGPEGKVPPNTAAKNEQPAPSAGSKRSFKAGVTGGAAPPAGADTMSVPANPVTTQTAEPPAVVPLVQSAPSAQSNSAAPPQSTSAAPANPASADPFAAEPTVQLTLPPEAGSKRYVSSPEVQTPPSQNQYLYSTPVQGAAPAAAAPAAPSVVPAQTKATFDVDEIAAPGQATPGTAPAADPNAPHTQVYSDEQAGTSVKIFSKPPEQAPPPPVQQAPPVVVPEPVTAAPPPAPVQTAAPPATTGTIEEQLSTLEMRLYGRKQNKAPIFKRLEKLEGDTSGAKGQGTVQERVDALLHAYGL